MKYKYDGNLDDFELIEGDYDYTKLNKEVYVTDLINESKFKSTADTFCFIGNTNDEDDYIYIPGGWNPNKTAKRYQKIPKDKLRVIG